MKSGQLDNATPVARALDALHSAAIELIAVTDDGGLDHHDAADVLIMLDAHATIVNQLHAVDAQLIAAGERVGVVEHTGQRTIAKVVEQVCRISSAEARRRTRIAEAIGSRVSPVGLVLPPLRDRIGAAVGAGTINAEQASLACRTLTTIERAGTDPDRVEAVETELVDHAKQYGPRELSLLCRRYLDIYDPDGTEPNDQRNHDRRSFTMRHTPAGTVVGEFRLTGATGAKLAAILEPLAKPRIDPFGVEHSAPASDQPSDSAGAGRPGDSADQPGNLGTVTDRRTREQRLHDALDDACSRLLRAGGLPETGGVPASVMITIDINDLLHHTRPPQASNTSSTSASRSSATGSTSHASTSTSSNGASTNGSCTNGASTAEPARAEPARAERRRAVRERWFQRMPAWRATMQPTDGTIQRSPGCP